ncbi:hypothetical protein, partial [Microvirga antarctica]|uniref:hypothetical protein n=1 Tax=Microvirga antarctica TaxID=2819233 RepID=UPI001B3080C7
MRQFSRTTALRSALATTGTATGATPAAAGTAFRAALETAAGRPARGTAGRTVAPGRTPTRTIVAPGAKRLVAVPATAWPPAFGPRRTRPLAVAFAGTERTVACGSVGALADIGTGAERRPATLTPATFGPRPARPLAVAFAGTERTVACGSVGALADIGTGAERRPATLTPATFG